MTGNDLVEPALRLLGIIDEIQTPSAEQGATGLQALNLMMADLSGDGVDVGYAPQSDPAVDVGLNIEVQQAVTYMLAAFLAPIYERTLSPVVAVGATMGRNKLLRDSIYQTRTEATMTHVPLGEGYGIPFNILTGY